MSQKITYTVGDRGFLTFKAKDSKSGNYITERCSFTAQSSNPAVYALGPVQNGQAPYAALETGTATITGFCTDQGGNTIPQETVEVTVALPGTLEITSSGGVAG